MNILIIIPTYNEAENVTLLITKIFKDFPNVSILIIDDNSPDGTYEAVKNLIEKEIGNLNIIQRSTKLGIASAYIYGFKWGIQNGFDVFCEMDADFSHNPDYLKIMIEKIKFYEIVIGSRNIRNGKVKGWTIFRNFISKMGNLYSRTVLKKLPIYDLTGGYNMYTLSALEKINIESIISKGFLFQIEMKYKAWKNGCKIIEVPIVFENRKYGKSKMNLNIFWEALIKIWEIRNN